MSSAGPASYVLGHSLHEQERLMLQGRVLRPYTDRFFRAAGIAPGMRVLDLGSGMGDVALLTGDIVGPGGCVVGVDRDPAVIERARQRAIEQGCSSWVTFQHSTLDAFSSGEQFDALVGRLILLYQPDAAATLRRMAGFVKPGGIVAFHEMDFNVAVPSYPPCPLWNHCSELVAAVFRLSGLPPDCGRRLARIYLDAGLSYPSISGEIPTGGGRHSYLFPWFANTIRSLGPRFEAMGLSLPPGVALDDTLAARLEEEAVALGAQIVGPHQYGAWARTAG